MLQDANGRRSRDECSYVEISGSDTAEPDGDRLLPGLRVGPDVSQVVGLKEGRGKEADRYPDPESERPRKSVKNAIARGVGVTRIRTDLIEQRAEGRML